MGFLDGPLGRRLSEAAEERFGISMLPKEQVEEYRVQEREFGELAQEVDELAFQFMDYGNQRPHEMGTEKRRRIAQKSRVALKVDPLASAEANLLGDFAFGKGVPMPTAEEKKLQDVIGEAWKDPNNQDKLTGYQAQRALSNELITTGEWFFTAYVADGKVRLGRLDPDLVEAVIPDPEDRLRPLWYMVEDRSFEWDFVNDCPKPMDAAMIAGGKKKYVYYPHWRNLEEAERVRKAPGGEGLKQLPQVPAEKIRKGLVYHVAINRTGEELRGNPPWARSLRFFSAMNKLTEAHVAMAEGASTIIAKRVQQATPNQLRKSITSLAGQVSEIGARRGGDGAAGFAPGGAMPPSPASWWTENQSSKLESVKLDSGAGQMAQTAQIVRAPIAAAAGFGQHYLGDASNANLATASTLELPSTMRIEAWQENFAQVVRWFMDLVIEEAVKAGRLGGVTKRPAGGKLLSELRLSEADDFEEAERRTDKKLKYEFVMPFPGRRQLAEVQAFVVAISQSMDPNGVNIPLRKTLLTFAFEQLGMDDVGHVVDECIPEDGIEGGIGKQPKPPEEEQPPGAQRPSAGQPGAGPEGDTAPGAPRQEAEWIPPEMRASMQDLDDELSAIFAAAFKD